MLRSIHAVTYTLSNFDASCSALQTIFDYRRIDVGRIGEELATFWGAPAITGSRYATYEPSSGEPVFVRFIEQASTATYEALKSFGWNATELHVEDVHSLAASLVNSPFEILGGPRDLLENGTAIALQARGPSSEVFYLTEINGEKMQRDYGKAASHVGRPFIVVLGCADHSKSLEFYSALCRGVTEPQKFPIRVLATAHELDPFESRFPIASAILRDQFRIELDGYPNSAVPRPINDGFMPPGLCLVSFLVDSLDELPFESVRSSVGLAPGFCGRQQTTLMRGPDGELLELIAAPG